MIRSVGICQTEKIPCSCNPVKNHIPPHKLIYMQGIKNGSKIRRDKKLSSGRQSEKMTKFKPEGKLLNTESNRDAMATPAALIAAMESGTILEARATVCDSSHNLIVDLGCMNGVIPREECALGIAQGTTRDIAIISRVGKPVCFTVTKICSDRHGIPYATLSRRAVQQQCMEQYISSLRCGDVIDGKVTHLEQFGAFVDVGCGIPSLMSIDTMSVSRISHPSNRFTVGMDIKAVVRSKEPGGRISLSHRELLGTWEQNAAAFSPGGHRHCPFGGGIRGFRGDHAQPRRTCGTPGRHRGGMRRKRLHQEHYSRAHENQAGAGGHLPISVSAAAAKIFLHRQPYRQICLFTVLFRQTHRDEIRMIVVSG